MTFNKLNGLLNGSQGGEPSLGPLGGEPPSGPCPIQPLGCPLGGRYPWTPSYPLIIHTTD